MKLSHFNFELPEERLTEYPSDHRDESRLMVLNRKKETIDHKYFKDIIDYFNEGDTFVLNNTKVFPARLFGNKEKTGARIEVFLLRELNDEQRLWDVLVDPARKIRIGNKLFFGENDELIAEVIVCAINGFFEIILMFLFGIPFEPPLAQIKQIGFIFYQLTL